MVPGHCWLCGFFELYVATNGSDALRPTPRGKSELHDSMADRSLADVPDDSDHDPSWSHGIAVRLLHTADHPEFHLPRKDAEWIDSKGLTEITHLA